MQCLQLLITAGCNITATDQYGDTAKTIATRHNHIECIKTIDEHLKLNEKSGQKMSENATQK